MQADQLKPAPGSWWCPPLKGYTIEHGVACQVYLKSLPLLLSHVCLCLGEKHVSVKQATGVKGAVCVLLVAALSVV